MSGYAYNYKNRVGTIVTHSLYRGGARNNVNLCGEILNFP